MEPTQNNSNAPIPSHGNGKKIGIGIAVIAVLALIGITIASNKKSDNPVTPTDTTSTSTATMLPPTTTTPPPTTGQNADLYKDGTYTATGSYVSPGGADQIAVTLTLKDDKVVDASVTPMPGDKTSAHYQGIFAANYKQYVIGQDIATLNLDKVSGSSLTGQGFNDAVEQIEAQAKA